MTVGLEVRSQPCQSCPYRCDVPPGVWHRDEYDKLVPYDSETGYQPTAGFRCHVSPDHYCAGWAIVHTRRPHQFDLLALRLRPPSAIPETTVALFATATEAAAHGQGEPTEEGLRVGRRLLEKFNHLST